MLNPELHRTQNIRIPLSRWADLYLDHYFTTSGSAMHDWMVEQLDGLHIHRGQKFAIVAPRGSAKTTWISKAYPLYCALYALEPYILLISNTQAQSEKNLAAVRDELESNQALKRAYSDAAGKGPVWNQTHIETRSGICIEALGMDTKMRGRTFGPHRPSLIVIDDLENEQSVESEKQRAKANEWLNGTVIPAGTDQTNIFVLGSALHRKDLLQSLSERPGWKSRTFRAIIHEPANTDLWREWDAIFKNIDNDKREEQARDFYERHRAQMDVGAELLWPQREPLYELMCLRATIGESAFQAEKQSCPVSRHDSEWPADYFGPSIWFDHWPKTRWRTLSLDPSKGETDTSDFSAFVMLGLGLDGRMYVEADLARRDASQMVDDALEIVTRFHPDGFLIETNQFQMMIKSEIERIARQRGMIVPLHSVSNTKNKRSRIRTLTSYLRDGMFRFKSNSPGTSQLVDQLREFPNARYDDGPDALEMAVSLLRQLRLPPSDALPIQEIVQA